MEDRATMNSNQTLSVSPDFSDEDDWEVDKSELSGTLNKWTNYIHGWQKRFIAVKDGSLVYYRSESETDFGCRGAISLNKAVVIKHELDELRFDISVGDCSWYLRAATLEEREKWTGVLESYKKEAKSIQRHRRQGSDLSLVSNTLRKAGHQLIANSRNRDQALAEKIAECETFRDLLSRQIDTLQGYFDTCSSVAGILNSNELSSANIDTVTDLMKQHGCHAVDFKGEALTFKATTAGILATLQYCSELMSQKEEQLKRKIEKEQFHRREAEAKLQSLEATKVDKCSQQTRSGPDYQEGPHSQLGEDEFFDAVETALDKLDEELEMKDQMKTLVNHSAPVVDGGHKLDREIREVSAEQLKYARIKPGEGSTWELFADEGEMKMYKREEEVDGMVVDPLKALHSVTGVTAWELCHYFWSPDVRLEWEHTIDAMTVLEELDSTLIFHQVHKRVWPTAQRDAVFWSHMKQVPPTPEEAAEGVVDCWLVTNKSTDHKAAPQGQGGCLRVILTVCFLCQTVLRKGVTKETARRDDLTCRITYCSVVNPGGWAPSSVLRAVYKREYPRFLKRFTQYVGDKTKSKEINW